MLTILLTGGAGYIGSHTAVELLKLGHDVVIYDNFSNSSKSSIAGIEEIVSAYDSPGRLEVVLGDVCDIDSLTDVFLKYDFDLVLHFAGLKSVSESNLNPLAYYRNNFIGTVTLCEIMEKAGVFKIIFSSSATVYGDCQRVPISEDCPANGAVNPYGRTKMMAELFLKDLCQSNARWSIGLLRYFNPVGAHETGLIGENPRGTPNNLFPYIADVAKRKLSHLTIFGTDYPTRDGTGVRDYIHVSDLASGHVAAMDWVLYNSGTEVWNLGTGRGYSVLEVVDAFKRVTGQDIPCNFAGRREGDVAESCADPTKALRYLEWQAKFDLNKMVVDAWRWKVASGC